jgi:hypothetical protein
MTEVNEPVASGERAGEGLGGEVLRYVGVGDAMTQIAANLHVVALEHISEHSGIVPGRCHRSCNARHAAEVPVDVSWLCIASRGPYASYRDWQHFSPERSCVELRAVGVSRFIPLGLAAVGVITLVALVPRSWPLAAMWAAGTAACAAVWARIGIRGRVVASLVGVVALVLLAWEGGLYLVPAMLAAFVLASRDEARQRRSPSKPLAPSSP